jgi:anti-sigma regulatory factor (Ser/Thr protein kinase)
MKRARPSRLASDRGDWQCDGALERSMRFPPTFAGFEEGASALHQLLTASGVAIGPRNKVEVAFEEIAVNIIRYGRATSDVEVQIDIGDAEVVLTFEDDGVPFDPREHAEPAVPASLDEAPIGGRGISMLRKISTRMDYLRTSHDRNRLTLAIHTRC